MSNYITNSKSCREKKLAVSSLQFAVGSLQSAVSSLQLAVCSRQFAVGGVKVHYVISTR